MGSASKVKHPYILLFDGVCNLCNGFVNFIIDRDLGKNIKFASLQSDTAAVLMQEYGLDPQYLDSVVLLHGSKVYTKSRAALEVLKLLKFPWKMLYGFILLPAFIRDRLYNWVATNRYRWFGKRDECRIPTPELRERFLDS